MRRLIFVVLVCGCLRAPNQQGVSSQENSSTTQNQTASVVAEKTEVDPKIEKFKTQVVAYLDESRAGVKLIGITSDVKKLIEKSNQMTDLYSRLPDTPEIIPGSDQVSKDIKAILGMFGAAVQFAKIIEQFNRIGESDDANKTRQNLDDCAAEIKKLCNKIETAIQTTN